MIGGAVLTGAVPQGEGTVTLSFSHYYNNPAEEWGGVSEGHLFTGSAYLEGGTEGNLELNDGPEQSLQVQYCP